MSRYIKKFPRVGHSLGPSEERGFELWVGYDIHGVDGDLSQYGLINVDGWDEERLKGYGVRSFTRIEPQKLGIR
jgi:hypothetical protein